MLRFPKVSHSLLNFVVFPAFRCQHYLILILQYRYKYRFLCDTYCWLIPRQHKQEKQIFVFIPSTVISGTPKKKHFIVVHTHLLVSFTAERLLVGFRILPRNSVKHRHILSARFCLKVRLTCNTVSLQRAPRREGRGSDASLLAGIFSTKIMAVNQWTTYLKMGLEIGDARIIK